MAEPGETDPSRRAILDAGRTPPESTSADAITAAARTVAETLKTAAIVCYPKSGSTRLFRRPARARAGARGRPPPPPAGGGGGGGGGGGPGGWGGGSRRGPPPPPRGGTGV